MGIDSQHIGTMFWRAFTIVRRNPPHQIPRFRIRRSQMRSKQKDRSDSSHIPLGYRTMWREKYNFNRKTLGLNEQAAQKAADRTIQAILKTEAEFLPE